MKRLLTTLIVVGGLGFLGWTGYHNPQLRALLGGARGSLTAPAAPSIPGDAIGVPAGEAPRVAAGATFNSRLPPPAPAGEKQLAPPGYLYMRERVKVETATGVQAVSPGEPVKIMQRLPNGRVKVTVESADFTVKESQVTNDLDVARGAERQDWVRRGGTL